MIPDLEVRDEDQGSPSAPADSPPDIDVDPIALSNNPVEPLEAAGEDVSDEEPADEAPEQADAEDEPDTATVEELTSQVSDLTQQLESATRRADEVSAIARRQSDMVDELHTENRTLRAGEIREAVAPLVRGLARLSDDLARMRLGPGAESADLKFVDGRVAELLHDCGVLPERPELGSAFDPQVHQATGSATTEDPSANRTIAELRRAGLRRDDGRMLRPADVVVYRYVAPVSPPPAEPEVADAAEVDAGASDDTAGKEEVA